MSTWVWVLAAVAILAVVVGLTTLVATRIRRLDRLHVRTDAARAGLEAALERRADAALVLAVALEASGGQAAGIRTAVAGARAARVSGEDREGTENVLGRELAAVARTGVPDAVLEELVDAEQLLILARRVHNDAVRDTRDLRSRRLVRWLHLAGTATMPEYFEIAESFEIADPGPGVQPAAPAHPPVAPPA